MGQEQEEPGPWLHLDDDLRTAANPEKEGAQTLNPLRVSLTPEHAGLLRRNLVDGVGNYILK